MTDFPASPFSNIGRRARNAKFFSPHRDPQAHRDPHSRPQASHKDHQASHRDPQHAVTEIHTTQTISAPHIVRSRTEAINDSTRRRDSFFDAVGPVYDSDEDPYQVEEKVDDQATDEHETRRHFHSHLRQTLIEFYKEYNPRIAEQFESGIHQQLLKELINDAGMQRVLLHVAS